jgi:alpha/beta superfamily hydrolase
MVRRRTLKIIRSKETSQIAVVTGSKRNKWDNPNNIRRDTSRHFWNKKREYLKDEINELATNSKNKNIRGLYRGINDFKRDQG